jgi:type 1 glutamine amidotransferase
MNTLQKGFFIKLWNSQTVECQVWECKKIHLLRWLTFMFLYLSLNSCTQNVNNDGIRVLILSGRNNHEWEKTTAVLDKMYGEIPVFKVSVTEKPDTLEYDDLVNFDVIVSNWNNWPENDILLDTVQEAAFLKFVENGGGMVFFHAGASSYYSSEIYHRLGIGRWGTQTAHGTPTRARITRISQEHPITEGIPDFFIMDEVWEKTDVHPDAEVLAGITALDESDGHPINGDAVFVNRIGKGRSFYTILGHDERALFNTGFQTLMIRGTEWAARGKVTLELPRDFLTIRGSDEQDYHWVETDTSLQFLLNSNMIWQYNFRNRFGKTYFHPLYLRNNRLTCESPADHSWHPGLWFSWKFINGINYWEYRNEFKTEKTGYRSEGITALDRLDIRRNSDFSTGIDLEFLYHPEGMDPVLRETRNILIHCPDSLGQYYIDYQHTFSTAFGDVILDRTPILGEPGGQSWGGYGGLTVRFNQDFTEAVCIPPVKPPDFPKGPWFYMGFNSLTGEQVGISMFQHPDHTTPYTRWYYATDPSIPFFFFTPAAIYDKNITLEKGESLTLKYRVWITGETSGEKLDAMYDHYIRN